MSIWSEAEGQAAVQMERMAQAVVARVKYCKQQFIYHPQHTRLLSAQAVHHLPIRQAATDLVRASGHMRWQRVVVAVQVHLVIVPQLARAEAQAAVLV